MLSAESLYIVKLSIAAAFLVAAVVIEFQTAKIPNRLTLSGLAVGMVICIVDQLWLLHLSGFIMGCVVGFGLYCFGAAGAGFTKLIIATGAIVGPWGPIATAVFALLVLAYFNAARRSQVPPEIRFEGEKKPAATAMGSVLTLVGTIAAIGLERLIAGIV